MQNTANAPTAAQVAILFGVLFLQLIHLQKCPMKEAAGIIRKIYRTENWAEYFLSKWKEKRNYSGLVSWACNMDSERQTDLLNFYLKTPIQHPILNIPESTIAEAKLQGVDVNDAAAVQGYERGNRYTSYSNFAWEMVAFQKFCVYCLNTCSGFVKIGKATKEVKNSIWLEYYLALSEDEKLAFCAEIIPYN